MWSPGYFCIIAYSNPRFDKRMLLDFNYMTLEKLGYSDVEIGNAQTPSGEEIIITPRALGIDSMTIKEMLGWFRSKISD